MLLAQILLILFSICNAIEKFINNMKDKRLIGYSIVSIRDITDTECIHHCSIRDDCGSVNYHVGDVVCMLNKNVDENDEKDNVIDDKGWNYFKKQENV